MLLWLETEAAKVGIVFNFVSVPQTGSSGIAAHLLVGKSDRKKPKIAKSKHHVKLELTCDDGS